MLVCRANSVRHSLTCDNKKRAELALRPCDSSLKNSFRIPDAHFEFEAGTIPFCNSRYPFSD